MTTLGWSAFGSLTTKVLAQSGSFSEALSYTNVAIAVSAAVAALLVFAGLTQPGKCGDGKDQTQPSSPGDFRALATQARFADTRARLLDLAERFS